MLVITPAAGCISKVTWKRAGLIQLRLRLPPPKVDCDNNNYHNNNNHFCFESHNETAFPTLVVGEKPNSSVSLLGLTSHAAQPAPPEPKLPPHQVLARPCRSHTQPEMATGWESAPNPAIANRDS
jgi:hypothetical protein